MATTTRLLSEYSVRQRVVLYGFSAAIAAQYVPVLVWIVRSCFTRDASVPVIGMDYVVFWSAARIAIEHGASAVFSSEWMQPLEASVRHISTYSSFPYPPTFLLVIVALGLLPFGVAFIAFTLLGVAIYWLMIRRLANPMSRGSLLGIAAFPGAVVAIIYGQNSLLTAALAGSVLALLDVNSLFTGVCLALLLIKPQLGILFPIALICGRYWKVLAVASACSIAFVGMSVAAFGYDAWIAFAANLPMFDRLAIEHGPSMWINMPTTFALARLAGCSMGMAYLLHLVVAVPAVAAMAYLWFKRARFELRAAALIVATLLAQPYLMYYDLVWLVLPMILLVRDRKWMALSAVDWAVLALTWLMPAQGFMTMMSSGPFQFAPLVMVLLLAIVMRRHCNWVIEV